MAFCTSCGTKLSDGVKFCTTCGTPQAAASQPAVPAQPAPVAAAPASVVQPEPTSVAAPAPVMEAAPAHVAAQPAAAAPQPAPVPVQPVAAAPVAAVPAAPVAATPVKKGGALKIVLIILGVLAFVVLALTGSCLYGAYKLKQKFDVQSSGNSTSIKGAWGGSISATNDAAKVAEQLNVDVYPNATALSEGSSAASLPGFSVATATFETSDSIDQVEAFYKERFPKSEITANDESTRTMVFTNDKGLITLALTNEGGKTKIVISRLSGSGKNLGEGSSE